MSDENFGDLHAWIEPEVEARIVAAILGEASDFERDELERLMDERPELRVFRRRLEAVHGLIGEAVKEEGEEWKLSPKRRGELLQALGAKPGAGEVAVIPEVARERRIGKAGRRVLAMAAACLLLTLIILPLATSRFLKSGATEDTAPSRTVAYAIEERNSDGISAGGRALLTESAEAKRPSTVTGATVDNKSGATRDFESPAEYDPPELPNSYFSRAESTPDPSEPAETESRARKGNVQESLAKLRSNLGTVESQLQTATDGKPGNGRNLGMETEALFGDEPASRATRGAGRETATFEGGNETAKSPPAPKGVPMISSGARIPVPGTPVPTAEPAPAVSYGLVDDGRHKAKPTDEFVRQSERARGRGMESDNAEVPDLAETRFRADVQSESVRPMAGKPVAPSTGPATGTAAVIDGIAKLPATKEGEPAAKVDPFAAAAVEGEPGPDDAIMLSIVPSSERPVPDRGQVGDGDGFGAAWGGGVGGGGGGGGGAAQQGQARGKERDSREAIAGVAGRMFREEELVPRYSTFDVDGRQPSTGWAVEPQDGAAQAGDASDKVAPGGYAGRYYYEQRDVAGEATRRDRAADHFAWRSDANAAGGEASNEATLGDRLSGEGQRDAWTDLNGIADTEEAASGGMKLERVRRQGPARGLNRESALAEQTEGIPELREQDAELLKELGRKIQTLEKGRKSNMELGQGLVEKAGQLAVPELKTVNGALVDPQAEQKAVEDGMSTFDAPVRGSVTMNFRSKTAEEGDAKQQLYTGEGFYTLGRYEQANEEFKKALRADPNNRAAREWMEKTAQQQQQSYGAAPDATRAQLLKQVDETWEHAVPPGEAGAAEDDSDLAGASGTLETKLRNIIIPRVDFEDTTVEEAVDFLRQRAMELDNFELDPAKKGINFVVRGGQQAGGAVDAELDAEGGLGAPDPGQARIKELKLENVPLGTVLDYITGSGKLRYRVDDHAVTMLPLSAGEGEDLVTRSYPVPPTFLSDLSLPETEGATSDPFAAEDTFGGAALKARRPLAEILKDSGISFPEGATATYVPGSSTLVVTNTPSNLDLVGALAESVVASPGERPPEVDKELFDRLENSGPGAKNLRKLQNIIVPLVDFENASVEDALHFVEQRSRVLDTEEVDPTAKGLDVEIAGDEDGDGQPRLGRVSELKLRNVPLHVVLDYMGEQAGFTYEVGDEGVKVLPRGGEHEEPLWTSEWKVHPEVIAKLREGQEEPEGEENPFGDDTTDDLERHLTLEDLLKNSGIAFPEGSTVRYSPANSTLTVRNSRSNLDLVDLLFESVARQVTMEEEQEEKLTEGEKTAEAEPFSTFSLHVSDVSFKLAQAALAKGEWPEAERVRVEEFVNALDYGDPAPSVDERVACRVEQAIHPFLQQRNLMRVSMRTAALGRNAGTPLRLTVLLDNSGSMEREDRVQSVQNAFELLAAQMNPQDEVTLISFARTPRLLRDRVKGDQVAELVNVVAQTPSEGGTNLEQALQLGVEKAKANFLEGAQNRIVLLTDGAANLGNAQPDELAKMVESMRQEGIAFDACGVGAEGLNDEVLESLTRKGDGRYYFLDRPEDADAGFAKQIAGALRPAAKNVKVQVEFNPKRVGRYKLLGFEKHRLEKEDFRNDSVDAAEMAAEEEGVAVYQFETLPEGEGDVGTVSVRFRDMESGRMVERRWPIPYEANPDRVQDAEPSLQLAASAAMLAERLKGTAAGEVVDLREVEGWTRNLQGVYPKNERVRQLHEMTARVRGMSR